MDDTELSRLLTEELSAQDGVVSRRQLLAAGAKPHDLRRWERQRLLSRRAGGVLVSHTGELTWAQRTWVAVLALGPGAALCWGSWTPPGQERSRPDDAGELPLVHVAVDESRRLAVPPGVRVHQVTGLATKVGTSPPARSRSSGCSPMPCAPGSPPPRGCAAVLARRTLWHRQLVLALLDDVESGTHSVLGHRYRTRVERAHGLPVSAWQRRRVVTGSGVARTEYADAHYDGFDLDVELDGRTAHEGWDAENADAQRDLDRAAAGGATLRLRHRQVLTRPCDTATRVAAVLQRRGWAGAPVPCGADCSVPAEDRSAGVTG